MNDIKMRETMDKYEKLADKFFNEIQVKFSLFDARKELAKRVKEFCNEQEKK